MSSISEYPTVRVLVVGKARERLPVSKREAQKFDMETFILKKLYDAEVLNSFRLKYHTCFQLG
jgi:hypothetical protein